MSKVKGCNYRVVRKATGEVVVAIEHGKASLFKPSDFLSLSATGFQSCR